MSILRGLRQMCGGGDLRADGPPCSYVQHYVRTLFLHLYVVPCVCTVRVLLSPPFGQFRHGPVRSRKGGLFSGAKTTFSGLVTAV